MARAECVTSCSEVAHRLTSGASFPPRLIAWLAGVDEVPGYVWETFGLRRAERWIEEALAGRRSHVVDDREHVGRSDHGNQSNLSHPVKCGKLRVRPRQVHPFDGCAPTSDIH